jgi:hypothetical protein
MCRGLGSEFGMPPLWLPYVILWSEVLGCLSYGGVLKFFSQFSGGPQSSKSILCTSLV